MCMSGKCSQIEDCTLLGHVEVADDICYEDVAEHKRHTTAYSTTRSYDLEHNVTASSQRTIPSLIEPLDVSLRPLTYDRRPHPKRSRSLGRPTLHGLQAKLVVRTYIFCSILA